MVASKAYFSLSVADIKNSSLTLAPSRNCLRKGGEGGWRQSFFLLLATPHGMQDLSSPTWDPACASCSGSAKC